MPFSIGEGTGSRSNAQPIAPPTSQNAAGKGEFHMDAVTTIDLSKIYGKRTALHAVDLSVPEGAIFGLFEPNSLAEPRSSVFCAVFCRQRRGALRFCSFPRKRMGSFASSISFKRNLYGQMSGLDNLLFFSSFYQISPADARERATYLVKNWICQNIRDTLVSTYSPVRRNASHWPCGFAPS